MFTQLVQWGINPSRCNCVSVGMAVRCMKLAGTKDGGALGDLVERLHDFSGIEEHRVEASVDSVAEVVVAHIR